MKKLFCANKFPQVLRRNRILNYLFIFFFCDYKIPPIGGFICIVHLFKFGIKRTET